MIRSDSFKNNIAAYSTLQIPSLGTLPPIRNGGNLVYDNSNKTFNYSKRRIVTLIRGSGHFERARFGTSCL